MQLSLPARLNKLGEKNAFHVILIISSSQVKICGVISDSYISLTFPHPLQQQILLTLKHTQHLTTSYHVYCCHPNPSHHVSSVEERIPASCIAPLWYCQHTILYYSPSCLLPTNHTKLLVILRVIQAQVRTFLH